MTIPLHNDHQSSNENKILRVLGWLIMVVPGPTLGYLLLWRQGRYLAFCVLIFACSIFGNTLRVYSTSTRAYVEMTFKRKHDAKRNVAYGMLGAIMTVLALAGYMYTRRLSTALSALFFAAGTTYFFYLFRDKTRG